MAWTSVSTRNETLPISRGGWLDALRFIVAALIILHHFQGAGPIALAESVHPMFVLGMALAGFAQKVWIDPRLARWAGIGAAVALFAIQLVDKQALASLACIAVIILAAGAIPTPRPSSRWKARGHRSSDRHPHDFLIGLNHLVADGHHRLQRGFGRGDGGDNVDQTALALDRGGHLRLGGLGRLGQIAHDVSITLRLAS